MSLPPKYTDEPTLASPATKSYGAVPPSDQTEALLQNQATSSRSQGMAWTDQPASDDLPDDFKLGVNVIDCDAAIRLQFIRKVYSILFVQLLATSLVSLALAQPAAVNFTSQHGWIIWIPMLGSFISLGLVYWKRHQHPANLILLGLFTIFEAMMVGTITSFYDSKIVSGYLFTCPVS
jgi:FtsH-binding integral membrane protein